MVNPLKEMELLRRVKKEEAEEEEEEDEKEEQETIASASKKAESSSSSAVAAGVPQDGSLGRPFEKQKMQESFERHRHHVTGTGGVEVEENSEDTLPTVSGFMDSEGGGEGMDQDQSPLLGKHHNGRSEEIQEESTSSKAAAASSSEAVEVAAQTVKEMEVKYAAYMRHDMYGNWGMNSVPVLEKVKLLLALLILCPIRFCLLLFFLVVFYLICKVCTLRVVASSNDEGQESFAHMTGARRAIVVRSGRFLARVMLFVFGFYNIHVVHRTPDRQLLHLGAAASSHERTDDEEEEEEEEEEEQFGAIVSNHVSYLDILYHMSASFPSFVAKRSVGKLPLVGLISKCLGCVYVQRESKSSDFKGVSALVSERLQAAYGDPTAPAVLLFPEGTTTNGEHLLPFKTGAFLAQTPVKPVILKYPYKRFSPAWDTISGFRHLVILMCQFVNHMEVIQLPVYSPSEKELTDPKLYANNVRAQMAVEGNLTMSDIGLYEKRIFHSALLRTRFPIAPAPEESFTRTQSN